MKSINSSFKYFHILIYIIPLVFFSCKEKNSERIIENGLNDNKEKEKQFTNEDIKNKKANTESYQYNKLSILPNTINGYVIDTNFIYSYNKFGKDSVKNISIIFRKLDKQIGLNIANVSGIKNNSEIFERTITELNNFANKYPDRFKTEKILLNKNTKNYVFLFYDFKTNDKTIMYLLNEKMLLTFNFKEKVPLNSIIFFLKKIEIKKIEYMMTLEN